jgi:hypothetical protein
MVQASTPCAVVTPEMRGEQAYRPRGRATWRVLSPEFEFISVGKTRFFGSQQEWVSQWHRVAITDPERTALDMVASPRVFGTLGAGLETLEAHLGRLDLDKLVRHALHYDAGAVIKRLGWILEALGVPELTTEPLHAYPVRAYHSLDPTRPPGGTPVPCWRVRNNLPQEGADAVEAMPWWLKSASTGALRSSLRWTLLPQCYWRRPEPSGSASCAPSCPIAQS